MAGDEEARPVDRAQLGLESLRRARPPGPAGAHGVSSRPVSQRRPLSVPKLLPDLLPKYLVTVGTRWYLLGLAAAPLYQRVPTSPNSHKHFQDSNSLGGTTKPQVRGLTSPISSAKSGYKCLRAEGGG